MSGGGQGLYFCPGYVKAVNSVGLNLLILSHLKLYVELSCTKIYYLYIHIDFKTCCTKVYNEYECSFAIYNPKPKYALQYIDRSKLFHRSQTLRDSKFSTRLTLYFFDINTRSQLD